MKEAELLGSLLPSHPDLVPIIEAIRQKYQLPEISPDDDPIEEIYLGDEIIPLEEFRQEIKNRVLEILDDFFPENFVKLYKSSKSISEAGEITDIERYPDDIKPVMQSFFQYMKNMMQPVYSVLNKQVESIVNMLYIHLLMGETQEVPSDWFGKVVTLPIMGEQTVIALAGEGTNIDVLIQQLREEYKETFGVRNTKITENAVSTAYYLQLKKNKKPWNFIVEEYIRLNKFSMPKAVNSPRYAEVWNKHAQRLKKRLQRTEKILDVIVRDKK